MLKQWVMALLLVAILTTLGCTPWPNSVSRSPYGPDVPDKWTSFVTDPPTTMPAAGVIDFDTLYLYQSTDRWSFEHRRWIRFFPNGTVAECYPADPSSATRPVNLTARDGERFFIAGRYAIVGPTEIRLEWVFIREAGGHNYIQNRATLAPDGSLLIRDVRYWFDEPMRYRPIHVGPMKGTPDW